ncbi:MAG: hypothetical protein PHD97_06890 [Bacteroidales bacterium]|nr:hypothetical protein [Bacteroidales bacterium]
MRRLIFVLVIFSIIACSPKVTTNISKTYPALDYTKEVIVIGLSEAAPPSAIEIGTVKVGDSGFSANCGWEKVIEEAKTEDRKAGGNAIKIIEHKQPKAMGSNCHRITAKILRIDNTEELKTIQEKEKPVFDSTWNYAKLFVFRHGGTDALVGYDLYIGDSLLCRVTNKTKKEIKIYKKGLNTIWAKTESKEEVPIDVEFGREYYLKCSVVMGIMVGRPKLQLIDAKQGKTEYNSIK